MEKNEKTSQFVLVGFVDSEKSPGQGKCMFCECGAEKTATRISLYLSDYSKEAAAVSDMFTSLALRSRIGKGCGDPGEVSIELSACAKHSKALNNLAARVQQRRGISRDDIEAVVGTTTITRSRDE